MTNIQEKVDSLIDERALLLSGKVTLEENKITAESERDFIFQYLTNNTSDKGILDIIALLAKEINYWDKSLFNKPNILADKSVYNDELKNRLNLAVSSTGDNDIYLNSNPSVLNTSSEWITNNGRNSVSFATSEFSVELLKLQNGLEAIRLKRAEVDELGAFVNRDYYDGSVIEEAISELKNILSFCRTNHTKFIEDAIDEISTNPFLNYPSILADVPSNILDFSSSLSTWEGTLQTNLDTLQGTYSRAVFDALLGYESAGEFDTVLISLESAIINRVSELAESFNETDTGFRKWYLFWMEIAVGKPQSSFVTSSGLTMALQSTISSLAKKKTQLETIFGGEEHSKFLPRPGISAVFKDEENRVNILLSSMPCFTKVSLYRKEIQVTDNLSNAPYTEVPSELLGASLIIQDDSSMTTDKVYSYRVRIHDEAIDMYVTSSDQSLVYEETPILFTTTGNNTTLSIPGHEMSNGQHIYITGTGLFQIVSKTSSTITLDREVVESGNLYIAKGIFYS